MPLNFYLQVRNYQYRFEISLTKNGNFCLLLFVPLLIYQKILVSRRGITIFCAAAFPLSRISERAGAFRGYSATNPHPVRVRRVFR